MIIKIPTHDKCAICQDEMNEIMMQTNYCGDYRICSLDCGHSFHGLCCINLIAFNNFDQIKCPLCNISSKSIIVPSKYDISSFYNAKKNQIVRNDKYVFDIKQIIYINSIPLILWFLLKLYRII